MEFSSCFMGNPAQRMETLKRSCASLLKMVCRAIPSNELSAIRSAPNETKPKKGWCSTYAKWNQLGNARTTHSALLQPKPWLLSKTNEKQCPTCETTHPTGYKTMAINRDVGEELCHFNRIEGWFARNLLLQNVTLCVFRVKLSDQADILCSCFRIISILIGGEGEHKSETNAMNVVSSCLEMGKKDAPRQTQSAQVFLK